VIPVTTIDIAGWRVQIGCRPMDLAGAIADRYANFITTEPPDLIADIVWENQVDTDSALPDTLPAIKVLADRRGFQLDGPGFSATIDDTLTAASLVIDGIDPMEAVECFARVVYALLAQQRGGLLLHAAGLLVEREDGGAGQVNLFFGQSGSGKSTVVKLSPQAKVLNDELVLLRPTDAGWIACGTPFWNREATGRQAEMVRGTVAGLYKLVQDTDVFVEPLTGATAIAELVANCPVVNSTSTLLPEVLALCRRLARELPAYRLHFRQAPDFWDLLPT